MISSAVLVFTIVVLAAGNCAAADEQESLASEAKRHFDGCAETIKIDMGVCRKMLDDGTNLNDPKYDSCKAMGACVTARFGIMVGNDYDFAKMHVQGKRLPSDELRAEAETVITKCGGTAVGPGLNETFTNIATCALNTSSKFKENVKKMANSA